MQHVFVDLVLIFIFIGESSIWIHLGGGHCFEALPVAYDGKSWNLEQIQFASKAKRHTGRFEQFFVRQPLCCGAFWGSLATFFRNGPLSFCSWSFCVETTFFKGRQQNTIKESLASLYFLYCNKDRSIVYYKEVNRKVLPVDLQRHHPWPLRIGRNCHTVLQGVAAFVEVSR